METSSAWVNETRKQCSKWAEVFTTTANAPKTMEQFIKERMGEWQLAVEEWFGRKAQKRVRSVEDETLRNQIVRGFVTVVDLSSSLEPQQSEPERAADSMLGIAAALQRLAGSLNRLRSTLPPLPDEQEEDGEPVGEPVGDKDVPTDKVPTMTDDAEEPVTAETDKPDTAEIDELTETSEHDRQDLPEFPTPTPVRIPGRRRGLSVPADSTTKRKAGAEAQFDSPEAKITSPRIPPDFASAVPVDDDFSDRPGEDFGPDSDRTDDSAVVVIPVDLTKDEDWDEPVVPLTRKKESSYKKRKSQLSQPGVAGVGQKADGRPERSSKAGPAGSAPAEQTEILGRLGVLLGWGLPRNERTLARGLARLDQFFGGPGEDRLGTDQREQLSTAIQELGKEMIKAVRRASAGASPETLDFLLSEPTPYDSADELPAAQLTQDLMDEDAEGAGLMEHLMNLRGPALAFRFEVHEKPGQTGMSAVPDNRLEFGLVAEPERILITALHLIAPSSQRPLGRVASSGLPGAGVFFQLQLPPRTKPVYRKAVQRFALSEVGRFVAHLRRGSR